MFKKCWVFDNIPLQPSKGELEVFGFILKSSLELPQKFLYRFLDILGVEKQIGTPIRKWEDYKLEKCEGWCSDSQNRYIRMYKNQGARC